MGTVRFQGGLEFAIHRVIGFVEVLATLGVAKDDVGHADVDSIGADLAGKRAFVDPIMFCAPMATFEPPAASTNIEIDIMWDRLRLVA